MAITFNWDKTYAPAECERGKYLPIDYSSISSLGYPSSGRGKYAELVYIAGGEVALNGVISADVINIETVNIAAEISSIPMQPTAVQYKSQTLAANSSAVIIFSPVANIIEIINADQYLSVYMNYGGTTFAVLTAQGLPLEGSSYYSIDRDVSTITIGNPNASAVDLRIFGHNRS